MEDKPCSNMVPMVFIALVGRAKATTMCIIFLDQSCRTPLKLCAGKLLLQLCELTPMATPGKLCGCGWMLRTRGKRICVHF
jgi:hypothetical protein